LTYAVLTRPFDGSLYVCSMCIVYFRRVNSRLWNELLG